MNEEKNDFSPDEAAASDFDQKNQALLNKQQKISIAALGVFAIFIMIFGIIQFRHNLYDPLDYEKKISSSKSNEQNNVSGLSNAEVMITGDLGNTDSDKDGLSDYEELNVYKTSPYLEDTDSDGFDDREEILNNTDPNCPAGQKCTQLSSDGNQESSLKSVDSIVNSSLIDNSSDSSQLTDEEKLLSDMLKGDIDLAVLRKMLLDSGMDKDSLEKISDDDLLSIYQETLTTE